MNMVSQRVVFDQVKLRGQKRIKCGCGRNLTRSRTFMQTINPFNKHKGELKTSKQIMIELREERSKWMKEKAEPCTH